MDKTNAMRLLDQKKIPHKEYIYDIPEAISGMEIAERLKQNPDRVFKTLVTTAGTNKYYVFVVPVNRELSLKKAAKAVGEKKIEMLKSKDLLPLTGYVHGGCSPIGMKKFFSTTFHESASEFETVFFSAGRIGYQVEIALEDLKSVIRFKLADLCE